MNIFILYPIFWGFLLLKDKTNHKLFSLIVLMYLLSGCASVYLFNGRYYVGSDYSFIAIAYHLSCLYLLLSPLKEYDNKCDLALAHSNRSIMLPFTIAIILIMLIYLIDGFNEIDFYTLMNDSEVLRQNLDEEYYDTGSIISYIAYLGKALAVVPLALMFYYIIHEPRKYILIITLLLCSMSSAIMSLREGGREYILKYLFVFVSTYYLCRKNISKEWKRKINLSFLIICVASLGLFFIISYFRFGTENGGNSIIQSFISYFGQGNINFNDRFVNYPNGNYVQKGHSLFAFIPWGSSAKTPMHCVNHNIESNVFGTGVGTWLLDCGWFLTLLTAVVYNAIFKKIGRIERFSVFQIIFFALIYEFVFSLMFFYHNQWTGTKVLIFVGLVACTYLDKKYSKENG